MRTFLNIICYGITGGIMASYGITCAEWQFWGIMFLMSVVQVVNKEMN